MQSLTPQVQLMLMTSRIAELETRLNELSNLQDQLRDLTSLYTELKQLLLDNLQEQRVRRRRRPDAAKHIPPVTPAPTF